MNTHFLKLNICIVCLIAIFFVPGMAMAEKCKPVHASLGEMVFYDPGCMLNGVEYYWCIERPTRGTLKGTYRFYSAPDFNGWDLDVPDEEMGTTWTIAVAYAISVFETKRGTLFTQESEVWHAGELEGWGAHFSITGGTGKYDGATGWMAAAGSYDSMALVGEVCTP